MTTPRIPVPPFVPPTTGYPPRPLTAVHPMAEVDPSVTLGEGVRIWACVGVLRDTIIGHHVSIGRCSEIGHSCVIGDGTRIGYNVFLPNGSKVGRNVFIGPNVTFCDDKWPKVPNLGDPPYTALPPTIGDGASIGAGCVILPGVTIGVGARVAAGAIVTKDVPNYCAVRGGPARYFEPPAAWRADPPPHISDVP